MNRYRGVAEEEWDWTSLGVPPPLTEDTIRQQKEKEKEKKKRAKQRKKDEESARATAAELEAVQRLEREKWERDVAGKCANCEKSLYQIASYDVFDRRCCSSDCVVSLRRKLLAEAAEKRMQKKT
jgi:hypothetical protein